MDQDTITAIATAPGRGGVGIIRLSGEQALTIAKSLTGKELSPRNAHYTALCNNAGTVLDHGICLYFPGPHSFTGEDVVELQIHGGPVILDLVLAQTCFLGARLARPGEFSERAFLNNKMDLAQAEAIADLINSTTAQAALNASRSLQGEFSQQINSLVEDITQLRVYTEAAIDFPEEEIDFLADGQITVSLSRLAERFRHLQQAARQGALLAEGMKLVIVGKPNAGKSSLLNSLSGRDSAIVTSVEGTTRDVLRENIQIDGMPLHIADTAGLRDSADEVEQEGIRRAWLEVESSDHVLLVVDSTDLKEGDLSLQDVWPGGEPKLSRDIPVTVVFNKCDLAGLPAAIEATNEFTTIVLSAKTGSGIDLLRDHLKQCMGFTEDLEGSFSARRRHLDALDRAESFLLHGQEQLIRSAAGELLAEDLRQCQSCLGEITGQMSNDELLGEIFSSFCIGK